MKFYSFKTIALALVCAGLTFQAVRAEGPQSAINSADEKFVKTASQHSMGELQIATLGVTKSSRADVKAIAEKMVMDHMVLNAELADLAKTKAVVLSVVTDPANAETLKSLENKGTGDEFDKAFLNELESGHKDVIAMFESAAEDSKDGELKTWAGKTLPTLRSHLEIIQAALKK